MERFVQLITGGGIALVAGLWIVTYLDAWSTPWLFGAILVALGGGGGLARGIWIEIDY